MLCSSPVTAVTSVGPQLVGCGQCFNCDVNKRRAWTARLLLEGLSCERNSHHVSWCTLTYNDDAIPLAARGRHLPPVETLRIGDYQRVFKRLRKRDRLGKFRYAITGEYGEKKERPHYHALLFGPDPLQVEYYLTQEWAKEFGFIQARPWRLGQKPGSDAAISRCAYLANYVTKKMHQEGAKELPDPQLPEFFKTSKEPPLGYSAHLKALIESTGGEYEIAETGDVPRTVRIAGKIWPLSRVLRERLRDDYGIPQRMLERHQLIKPTRPREQPTADDYYKAKLKGEKLKRAATRSSFQRL
jgi:hypothetical protein